MKFLPEIFLLQEQDDFSLCKLIIEWANSFALAEGFRPFVDPDYPEVVSQMIKINLNESFSEMMEEWTGMADWHDTCNH